ncbi:DinB family protein [Alkalimarinus coralli]|uniref:DinB family protein n=1 Tax=Alkalimarinus coralli TaxID=2935863 RepID=UPI00202B1061|nr:DinB family protein [Alkalimarinus coralli]
MNSSISGSLETIDQMISFIEGLSDKEYQYIAKPLFDSSIGQHLRHIVDLYLALMSSAQLGRINSAKTIRSASTASPVSTINYDIRRRGALIETEKQTGLSELADIRAWLIQNSHTNMTQEVWISTEVSLSSQTTELFKSSLGRELCFASSHLTHHLAIMAAIAKVSGKDVDSSIGLAPTTATFTREQTQCTGGSQTDSATRNQLCAH